MLPIVVLAGGLATRLRPLTEKIPKSLIEINDRPFVLHQLELLMSRGLHRVHYCLGYLGKLVEDVVSSSVYPKSMEISFSYDGETLRGTGGAIRNAFPYLAPEFFVTYGDSYLDTSYSEVEKFYQLRKDPSAAVMTIFKNEGKFDKSNAAIVNGVLHYSKTNASPSMEYIDYGLGVLSKNHFNMYPADAPFDLSAIYEQLSSEGRLLGFEVNNRFYEIGSRNGIEEIGKYLKS